MLISQWPQIWDRKLSYSHYTEVSNTTKRYHVNGSQRFWEEIYVLRGKEQRTNLIMDAPTFERTCLNHHSVSVDNGK